MREDRLSILLVLATAILQAAAVGRYLGDWVSRMNDLISKMDMNFLSSI